MVIVTRVIWATWVICTVKRYFGVNAHLTSRNRLPPFLRIQMTGIVWRSLSRYCDHGQWHAREFAEMDVDTMMDKDRCSGRVRQTAFAPFITLHPQKNISAFSPPTTLGALYVYTPLLRNNEACLVLCTKRSWKARIQTLLPRGATQISGKNMRTTISGVARGM